MFRNSFVPSRRRLPWSRDRSTTNSPRRCQIERCLKRIAALDLRGETAPGPPGRIRPTTTSIGSTPDCHARTAPFVRCPLPKPLAAPSAPLLSPAWCPSPDTPPPSRPPPASLPLHNVRIAVPVRSMPLTVPHLLTEPRPSGSGLFAKSGIRSLRVAVR